VAMAKKKKKKINQGIPLIFKTKVFELHN